MSVQEEMDRRPGGSFSVDAWCRHRGISTSMFYKMLSAGTAPQTLRVGRRRLITTEADAAWCERQADSPEAA